MPTLHLAPPGYQDIDELFAFEMNNREFFEARINARPASFYSLDGVSKAIAAAIEDEKCDRGYQFLVRTDDGSLVGRVNLTGIRREHFHCAALGYRVAESACGKGYAGEAVRQVLTKAFGEMRLMRVEAVTGAGNLASMSVLRRNGFVQFGHSKRSFELGGSWHDRLHFERHALAQAPLQE